MADAGVANYRVVFTRSARRELESLEVGVARRILLRVERLTTNPRPPGAIKLRGAGDLWRIRVGDYRVIYAIDDVEHLVDIRVVRHRSEVYG
ncbi:MAG: type II toxin-antitoxin system RelE family toxin [Acidobacteriota bacterium]